jgi:hypothetical protein
MVLRLGGPDAAKKLLRTPSGEVDRGQRLTEYGLDFLSVEWSVLNPRWRRVFTDEDRELAYANMDLLLREQGDERRRATT